MNTANQAVIDWNQQAVLAINQGQHLNAFMRSAHPANMAQARRAWLRANILVSGKSFRLLETPRDNQSITGLVMDRLFPSILQSAENQRRNGGAM